MKLYSFTANASQQSRWGIIDSPLVYKMLIIDKKSNKNKVFKMFFRKVREHTENTKVKVNIDIFYELFRLNIKR
jgi:hypothetical protein